MKTALFLVLVSLVGVVGETSAQNQKAIDSLTAVLATKVAGDRYSPLYELAFEYLDKDNERALEIIEEAGEAALLSGDSLWIVKSIRVRGQILYKLGRMAEAIPSFESSLSISGRNGFQQESQQIYSAFGLVDLFRGQFDRALIKFDTALQLSQRQSDSLFLIANLSNMGLTYYKLHDAKKALRCLFKGLEIAQRIKQPTGQNWAPISVNISLCYSSLHQFSSAEFYLKKSLQQCANGCPESVNMHREMASGVIFNGLRQYDLAFDHFYRSLSLARKRRDSRMIFDNLVKISQVLIAENRISEAERYLKDAEKLIGPKAAFPIGQIDVYEQFCQVYERMHNYGKLAFYQDKYIHLKDSVFNYQLTTRLMSAEAEFQGHENKARIAAQNELILLKEAVIDHQQRLNVLTGVLAAVILVFAIFMFIAFSRKKNLNALLERRVQERTRELQASRDELLRAIGEKDRHVDRLACLVSGSITTIEGLCATASKETSEPSMHFYIQKIVSTVLAIEAQVQSAMEPKD